MKITILSRNNNLYSTRRIIEAAKSRGGARRQGNRRSACLYDHRLAQAHHPLPGRGTGRFRCGYSQDWHLDLSLCRGSCGCSGRFTQLGWKGSASLDLAELQATSLPLQLQGDFNLSGSSLVNKRTDRLLPGFEDFSVKSLRAESLNNISSESVLLDNLVLVLVSPASHNRCMIDFT